ncbi:hypothetical protein AWM68_05820 [Fictibacillus phosphorivorans]|uniref:Flagellar Assembly Protein A N-terminal region domain-containing protein n=1 Tax=Fictibacillus phosphorivorans TaxID=1221500 RepID=A0A163QXK1_9BACL|nr:FapA family protein [Fictibacillus phosphorivorans]KZE65896.1 hypothetical protein AWM68_05820 [Fictibacillus phosphorivorans]
MDQWFDIKREQKDTRALLFKKEAAIPADQISFSGLAAWIGSKGIKHGVRKEVLNLIVENLDTYSFPAEIAKGKLPIDGKPAQLIPAYETECDVKVEESQKVDFKRLFTIPTVEFGEIVARKQAATDGIPGITVFGEPLPAKKGKDLHIKNGENTVFNAEDLCVYASKSGEVTHHKNVVHIYPVYRVQGDVSLKTGHIDFVGNVHIKGDVPSGFKILAQGDVRIEGVVEAAEIISQGNVVIGGGVLGQGKGLIRCAGNFTSLYISQGTIYAGENIEVAQTIMHSHCEAGQSVRCLNGKGNISGGTCIAGSEISANEIGNETYSKTLLYIKTNENSGQIKVGYEQKMLDLELNLKKLNQLKAVMEEKKMDKVTIDKIVNTILQTNHQLTELKEEKAANDNSLHSMVTVKGILHPNVEIGIGKYKRKVHSPFQSAKVFMEDKEIVIHSL